jgi:CheY-like chemotaxis protein
MSAKILVADESPTIHKIVAMAFEEEGITVEGISRGEHALEYMVEFQPDIVLADIYLPGTDGYELCRQIKNSPSFGSVRVILLTSDFEDIDKVELEISRADDFISKPFKTEEILKKVKSQLKIPEPEKEVLAKEVESPQELENREVIQNELEDIINQPKESATDSVKQLFPEDEDPKPSIDEIDLETDTPSASKVKESREEKPRTAEKTREDKKPPQDNSKTKRVLPEITLDLSEEAFRAETRPVKVKMDDLNSAFQSVLSSPKSGPEDAPKRKPGSKPNLIEETLSFMANQKTKKEIEIVSTPEMEAKKVSANTRDSADSSLADRIIEEHMDYVSNQIPEDARHDTPASFEKTVRAVLEEVAPKIIRQVIQEEIEAIKKTKEA